MSSLPITYRTNVSPPLRAAIEAIVGRHHTLEQVLDWCQAQHPPQWVKAVIAQDEFTSDLDSGENPIRKSVKHSDSVSFLGNRKLQVRIRGDAPGRTTSGIPVLVAYTGAGKNRCKTGSIAPRSSAICKALSNQSRACSSRCRRMMSAGRCTWDDRSWANRHSI